MAQAALGHRGAQLTSMWTGRQEGDKETHTWGSERPHEHEGRASQVTHQILYIFTVCLPLLLSQDPIYILSKFY